MKTPNTQPDALCHICDTSAPFLLTKDGYDMYRCLSCGLVFVYPQPEEAFLREKIYSYESGFQSNTVVDLRRARESRKTKKIFDAFTAIKGGGRLLDVGCSNGQFLWFANRRGFEVEGVELNRRTGDNAVAHGLPVFIGTLKEAEFSPSSFDFIFLGDVIEHVPDPRELVRECREVLKPDGILVIVTPNLNCLWAKITFRLYKLFRIPVSSLTPPYHVFQFSDTNLDKLLTQEHFSLQSFWYEKPPRLAYELGSLHLLKRFKKKKTIGNFAYMIFAFSLYTVFYGMIRILSPLLRKNFAMIRLYAKKYEN